MSKDLVFETSGDICRNAYMNWRTNKRSRMHNYYVLAEGFWTAAHTLTKTASDDNCDKKADSLIYAILYSFNQSIELYEKAVICQVETLCSNTVSNYVTHDIRSLFRTMKAIIKKEMISTKGMDKFLAPLEKYIDELYAHIISINDDGKEKINIDFSRYPVDTDGNPHFYIVAVENIVVDLDKLIESQEQIKEIFEGLYYEYANKLEDKNLI